MTGEITSRNCIFKISSEPVSRIPSLLPTTKLSSSARTVLQELFAQKLAPRHPRTLRYLQSIGIQRDLPGHLGEPPVRTIHGLSGAGAQPGAPLLLAIQAATAAAEPSDSSSAKVSTAVRIAPGQLAGQTDKQQHR